MSQDPMARLHAAVALHQGGRLAAAEPLYAALVAEFPGFADAAHLYGVLCARHPSAAGGADAGRPGAIRGRER